MVQQNDKPKAAEQPKVPTAQEMLAASQAEPDKPKAAEQPKVPVQPLKALGITIKAVRYEPRH